MLTVFTDGSSVNGNPGNAAGAYVIMREKVLLEAIGFPIGIGTNNEAELTAALCGLQAARAYVEKNEVILLVADSLYLLNGLAKCNRLSDEPTRQNRVLWDSLYKELVAVHADGSRIKTHWVHGHSRNHGNVLCDHLARAAAKTGMFQRSKQKERKWRKEKFC